jgi:predicted chitinase
LYWNPDRVASDEELSWNTAFWFWKFNVHSDQGVQNGQFGSATNRINGDQECHPCRGACNNRFGLYKNVLKAFNIQETPNPAGC